MVISLSSEFQTFRSACLNNDLQQVRELISRSFIDEADADGNTVLHIASSHGYTQLILRLLRYHASRQIKNKQGLTAEEVAINDETKTSFKTTVRPLEDADSFVGSTNDIEWIDSYGNAYRIAYENREHMKRWLLKVPFHKLLDEFETGYIDNMEFSTPASREKIKASLNEIRTSTHSDKFKELVRIYSDGGTSFCTKLNYDLAEIGSDFRFLSTQNLFNSGYLDNEAPKDLGQHIFAAILINHPFFQPFYYTGTLYRGMNITPGELKQYKKDDIVLTRSFLSTSTNPEVSELFRQSAKNEEQTDDGEKNQTSNMEEKLPILCVYEVENSQTSIYISGMSKFPEESEVLIVPFAVFRIIDIENGDIETRDKTKPVTIHLQEVESNT